MIAAQIDENQLLEALLSSLTLQEIASQFGIPLLDLLDWADSPHVRELFDRLQALADRRASLAAAAARTDAITALHQLLTASADDPREQRRIATALLRAGPRPRASRPTPTPEPHAAPGDDAEPQDPGPGATRRHDNATARWREEPTPLARIPDHLHELPTTPDAAPDPTQEPVAP